MARCLTVRKKPRGAAVTYISRKRAQRKLQLSLSDFRRLCILKGIYPVQHSSKNSSSLRTYYYVKDIQYLAHEPLIEKFRSFKVFVKKVKKLVSKQDQEGSKRMKQNEPTFKLDHIVKERYPTFIDALRDLDDVLSITFLFSTFPKSRFISPELILMCRRLTVEFLHYIVETNSLRKVFISIKGIYYQAEIMGQTVTWMNPHNFGFSEHPDVDFKIMLIFAEFYSRMLGFVNYKLYNSINLIYPPKLAVTDVPNKDMLAGEEDSTEFIAAMNISLKSAEYQTEEEVQLDEFPEDEDDLKEDRKKNEEKLKKLKTLFSSCKIFLNREVPKESLVFIIRCFGGEVSFDKTIFVGATFDEDDETITHQIVDRPSVNKQYINRYYIQPQWIYDSVNAGLLLPVDLYFLGEKLPPHLSPFVEEEEGDYVPPEKRALVNLQKGIIKTLPRVEESDDDDESEDVDSSNEGFEKDAENVKESKSTKRNIEEVDESEIKLTKDKVTPGKTFKENVKKFAQKEAAEEKRLAMITMKKKDKRLYKKITTIQKEKKREALKLKEKREKYEKKKKKAKKS